MGFFASETQRKKRKKTKPFSGAPKFKSKSPQALETLNRLGCRVCPLDKVHALSPRMEPSGSDSPLIMFLAEAPGLTEDEDDEPLIGESGQLLRQQIPIEFEDRVAYNNCVQTRPPNNRTPTWVEMECCRSRVITQTEQLKPKIIIGLGAIACDWALNSKDLIGLRGRLFAIKIGDHHCWFYPIYHPAFILRQGGGHGRDPTMNRMGHCFKMDLKRIFSMADSLPHAVVDDEDDAREDTILFQSNKLKSCTSLIQLLEAVCDSKAAAIDLETTGLYPYSDDNSKILSVSITPDDIDANTFCFDLDHPQSTWKPKQRQQILDTLEEFLLSDCIKVAHNAPFEMIWLIHYFGIKITLGTLWEDTMAQAYVIDERTGAKHGDSEKRTTYQSLDFLCWKTFGLHIKSLSRVDVKNLAALPLKNLLPYNAIDSRYTIRLWWFQNWVIDREELDDVYRIEQLRRLPTVARMSHIGIPVSQSKTDSFQIELEITIEGVTKEIDSLRVVKDFRKDHNGKFNILSNEHLIEIFSEYLNRPEIKVPEKYSHGGEIKYRYSTDDTVLKQIDHKLAKLVPVFRNATKLKKTYVDPLLYSTAKHPKQGDAIFPGSIIHPTWNTTFTETGRLSANHPSFMNWPKRKDKWVRGVIEAPNGYVFISADYGQQEGLTGAMCSHDEYLIEAFWNDLDIHMEWAEKIAYAYPQIVGGKASIKDKVVMKEFRSKVKNKFVFPAIYGAKDESIAGYLKMPIDVIADIFDDFWEIHSGLYQWQKDLMQGYYKFGYVETLTGRRRRYPLTRNQAINHPIQGSASDITVDSMNRLSELSFEIDNPYIHPIWNVHDDLSFLVEDKDKIIDRALDDIIPEMLDVPYKWINVPLSIEVSIGQSWANMENIGIFYSNKDL